MDDHFETNFENAGTQYIRRRSQLLRENAKRVSIEKRKHWMCLKINWISFGSIHLITNYLFCRVILHFVNSICESGVNYYNNGMAQYQKSGIQTIVVFVL